MLPSKRVYFLLALGILIFPALGIFIDIRYGTLLALIFDGVILALTFIDSLLTRRQRVDVSRDLEPRLSIGRDNPVLLKVKSKNSQALIKICDYYPHKFDVSQSLLKAVIPANSTKDISYTVKPLNRGEYNWGKIQVRQLGNWGLAWDNWTIPAETKIKVYPDLVGLRSLSIKLTLESSGSMRQFRRQGIGTEFAELRNYRTGDDLRLIDWKATARRLGVNENSSPLVKVLDPDNEQTLMILLDRGRLMTAQVDGLQRFDWGLNATLALALAGLKRGDRVGVGVFDRQINTWIPPERGQYHLNTLIDKLTPVQPVLLESDYLNAVTKVVQQYTRRCLVVVITDIVDVTASAELLASLMRLTPRYLPFCVCLRDPLVDNLAHTFTPNVTQAYTRAVSLDLLAQRQVAFAKLKQKGVLVLDAPANKITEQLIDRYLQLKARNLI
ncbi:MAG: DUF58 domain-containing protein [Cyanobacteria bacterium P01_A01_bin.84]